MRKIFSAYQNCAECHISFFDTSFGTGAVIVVFETVVSVHMPEPAYAVQESIAQNWRPVGSSPVSERVADLLRRYFAGERVEFDVPLDYTGKTTFQQAVLDVVRHIPYGNVMTYGEVAQRAGYPMAARGVGRVMATNRIPIIIPCHRVLGATGGMTGYSAPGGVDLKRRLLALEGLLVDTRGRVRQGR